MYTVLNKHVLCIKCERASWESIKAGVAAPDGDTQVEEELECSSRMVQNVLVNIN